MPKLDEKNQLKLTKSNVNIFLQPYGLRAQSFKFPKNGIENTTAIVKTAGGPVVLRVYRQGNKSRREILRELQFMDFLRTHGLPVPRILLNTHGTELTNVWHDKKNWNTIVLEFASGKHFNEYSAKLLKDMATVQATMHLLGKAFAKHVRNGTKPDLTALRETMFAKKANLKTIKNPKVKEFLLRTKKFNFNMNRRLPCSYNHLDFDSGNLLADKNRLSAILDFEDLTYCPSVLCLGYTLWDILSKDKDIEKVRKYLWYYQKVRKLSTVETKNLKPMILFRNYVVGSVHFTFWGERGMTQFIRLEKTIQASKF